MTADDWFSALALLARLPLGRLDLRVGPLDPIPRALVDGLPSVAFARTHVLRLDDLPRDRSSAYRASCRRAVRKAQSAGSSCSRLTSADELDAYYELYLDSVRRWRSVVGNVVLPRRLLQDLSRLPGVEFWGTRTRGGELAAGGVFLFWGRHVIYWHGAMLERLAGGRPSNLLHHAVIGAARERGFELYDFNPSAGIAGVEQFKESFGARRADVILFGWRNPLERRALARRLKRDA
jgi:hypothetical protein